MTTLWRNARLATLAGERGWGLVDDGAFVVEGDALAWVGAAADLPAGLAVDTEHDLHGALATPGLVDCHTHLVYGGQRAAEFEQRLEGATYEQIAQAGGGIRSTVRATREASDATLFATAASRARALMAEGVTTVEIKSGYGLSLEHEARQLRVARRLGQELPIAVRTTYLAAHAVPPEFEGRPEAYLDVAVRWMYRLQAEGLIDAVDAFCDRRIGFEPAAVDRFLDNARRARLPVKLHAEQLRDDGGARIAAHRDALSADHLEYLSDDGVRAMAASGTVAVLLPGAYHFLRETQLPPVQALRDAGVPIAVATDHNPGSSPTLSPLLMLNMACTLFRLTPEEALRGMTANGARALGLADRGRLVAGQRADVALWHGLDHPNQLAYAFGQRPACDVLFGGLLR